MSVRDLGSDVPKTDLNPYTASHEPQPHSPEIPREPGASLFYWRLYLACHLLVVAASAIWLTGSTSEYTERGTWRDWAIPLGPSLYPVAIIGFPLAYAAPVVVLILLVQAGKRGSAFAIAALVEFAIMLAHFYSLLPAVQ